MFSARGGFSSLSETTPTTDPYWANVSFLSNTVTGGTNNDRTITDSAGLTGSNTYGTNVRFSARNPFSNTLGSSYHIGNTNFSCGIKTGTNTNVNFSGDFTVETWAMCPVGTVFSGYPSPIISPANYGFFASGNVANKWSCASYGSPAFSFPSTVTSNDGVWRHLALVRNGTGSGNLKFYLDGVATGTAATTNAAFNWSTFNIGCGVGTGPGAGDNQFFGYLANMRFSNIARYTSNFTPPTALFTVDSNTKFLCTFQEAFWDVSNEKIPVLQTGTNINQSTTNQKWPGVNSMEGTGATASGVAVPLSQSGYKPTSTKLTLDGDFTIECWAYVASGTTQNATSYVVYGSSALFLTSNASGASNVYSLNISGTVISASATSKDSTWHHLAVVRNGTGSNNTTFYLDGISQGTASTSTTTYTLTAMSMMGLGANTQLIGFVDELRITKGVARYTSNFTVPSGPFPTS